MSGIKVKHRNEYQDFVFEFRKSMIENNIILIYEGEINQEITTVFSKIAESRLDGMEQSETVKRRVYHVMVECLQNICKHADDKDLIGNYSRGKGIFMVGNDHEKYFVTTGNVIANEKIKGLTDMIDRINNLSPEEAKEEYKKMIKASRISEKGGAGLGFIDIVKRTGNKLKYHLTKIDDELSFIVLVSEVSRRI